MKLAAEVSTHLHADLVVTPLRVRNFGDDSWRVQLAVLSELRRRAGDSSNDTTIGLIAVVISFVGLIVSPARTHGLVGAPLWASLVFGLLLGIGGAVVALPFLIRPLLRSVRREQAIVWLPAFEDEIDRRRADTTRDGKKWRALHYET